MRRLRNFFGLRKQEFKPIEDFPEAAEKTIRSGQVTNIWYKPYFILSKIPKTKRQLKLQEFKMREALEFYADPRSYEFTKGENVQIGRHPPVPTWGPSLVDQDQGKRAKEVLGRVKTFSGALTE